MAHDAAALMVRLPDGYRARLHASSGFPAQLPEITDVPEELPQNPDWEYGIVDDISLVTGPPYMQLASMGFKVLLRVPIRLDGRFAGALVLLSTAPSTFRHADIIVARRIADRLAVTLTLDREIAASKRADEATARASKLEARVRALTEQALEGSRFNKSKAAKALGLTRHQLYIRMRKYGLEQSNNCSVTNRAFRVPLHNASLRLYSVAE